MNTTFLLTSLRRRWQIVACAVLIGIVVAVFAARRSHEYYAESAVVLVDANNAGVPSDADATKLSLQAPDLPTLVQSTTLLTRVAKDIGFHGDARKLRARVKAHVAVQSDIMPIKYTGTSPADAVAGANAVADELTRYYRDISTSRYDRLISDLRSQIADRRRTLAQFDADIAGASAANPYLDAKNGTASINAEILDLTSKKNALATVSRGDSATAAVLDRLLADVKPLAENELGQTDPLYQALREQYAKDTAALTKMRVAYGSSNPGMPELKDLADKDQRELAVVQQRMHAAAPFASKSYDTVLDEKMTADAKVESDKAQSAVIEEQIANDLAALANNKTAGVSLAALRRQRDAADAGFTQLSARLTAAISDRAQAASVGSISVIDHAATAQRSPFSSPAVLFIEMISLALFAGFGIVLLLESNDSRLSTPARIADLYQAPVFATVGSSR